MSQPTVAAIVLNYNGKDLTLQSVESVLAMDYPSCDVVVVDNGSTDGSDEAVAAAFPNVARVRTETNRGPAGGLNIGIGWALERGYEYLLVLNNDIEVAPGMLSELVRVAEEDPEIGCVGPKIYYYWERERLWSAGGRVRFKESVTRERGMGEVDRGQFDRTEPVPYINGCAMLVRAKVMTEVGPFDPVFRLGVEDADWCMRMRRRGYRAVYAHRAVLWHMVSRSTGGYVARRTFETGRSSAIFVRRYASAGQWLSFIFFTAMAFPAAMLRELPRGNVGAVLAKLSGVLAGLRTPLAVPPEWPRESTGF